jgi:hypothetical protein
MISAFDNTLAIVIATAILLLCFTQRTSATRHPTLQRVVLVLLAAHTLYTAHTIIRNHPRNIFVDLGLGARSTHSIIRERMRRLGVNDARFTGPGIEELLSRLSSFDARLLLIRCVTGPFFYFVSNIILRFGHRVLRVPGSDQLLALFATAPEIALSYLLRATLNALVTLVGTAREERRHAGAVTLVVLFFAEMYYVSTSNLSTEPGLLFLVRLPYTRSQGRQ